MTSDGPDRAAAGPGGPGEQHDPAGRPVAGSSNASPPVGRHRIGAGRHAAGARDLRRLAAQRGEVGAAHVVDEVVLEGVQQHEGGAAERDGEQRRRPARDAQPHRAACPPSQHQRRHDAHRVVHEAVADRAHRLQAVAGERPVDLGAQVADVDLDDVVVAVEVEAPDLARAARPSSPRHPRGGRGRRAAPAPAP